MGIVVAIQPKTFNKRYRNQSFSITYLPETKKWEWRVTYIQQTVFSDVADTMPKAHRAAEKHIDKTLEMRG